MHSLKNKIERIRVFLDRIRYVRKKHFCLVLVIILLSVSAFSAGSYIYHKKEITRKDNILRSYFSDINKDAGKTTILEQDIKDSKDALTVDGKEDAEEKTPVMVYICGSVNKPGVYELDGGSRIYDLLKKCGGASDTACIEAINLAEKVVDGQKVYIPSINEVDEAEINIFNGSFSDSSKNLDKSININQDSADQLQKLPGIGQQISENIIDYRQKYGPFKSKEEIKNVNGIGEKKYEKIKDLISI